MIANVISSATEKVAADQGGRDQKVRDLLAYEKKEHGHIPTPSEEESEKTKTASAGPAYIEKLASAVEFIAGNFDTIEFPHKGLLQKAAEEAGSPQGAGKGEGALEVTHSTRGGTQNYNTGQAHNIEASTSKAHATLSGARDGDGKTQLENDMHHAPGGGGIAPTAKYPAKGPLVAGPSVKHAASVQDLYRTAVPKEKAASAIRNAVLRKLAGEDVMKANIDAERTANPLAGMGQLQSFDTSEPAPHQSGDASGGSDGNQGRRLISSNEAAINATKRDAKGPVKSQLSEVLEEPALSSSTDPVLNNNLQNTGKAGVKIAAARATLEKVAQQGCTCVTINGDCAFCRIGTKIAAATQSRGSTKTANAMMGYGGGAGMGGGSSSMGGGGGGMTSMADAGAGADGCTCGGTGECRICKLKAALAAAAKAGGTGPGMNGSAGPPIESGSPGAAPVGTY
jgi:hypothetical protein